MVPKLRSYDMGLGKASISASLLLEALLELHSNLKYGKWSGYEHQLEDLRINIQGVPKLVCQLCFEISPSYVDVLQNPFNHLNQQCLAIF